VVPLLIVAEQGREWGWGSGWAYLCYVTGVVGIAAFIAVEHRMGETAIIPLRIFHNRIFAQGIVISVVVGMVMFGAISMLPQYFQVLRGSSPTMAGLQMLPMVLGLMTASIASGQLISRTGHYRIYPVIGSVLITVSTFLLHLMSVDTPVALVMFLAFVLGFGLGNLMQPLTLALQNVLPPKDMGVSTASATFFRQIGGTLGVAVFFSVLFSLMGPNITDGLKDSADDPQFQQAVATAAQSPDAQVGAFGKGLIAAASDPDGQTGSVMDDTSVISKLPEPISRPIKIGFADAMDTVFLTVSIVSLISLVLVLFWKEVPLRTKSGMQAAKDADAET
jgi:hypothetical protein